MSAGIDDDKSSSKNRETDSNSLLFDRLWIPCMTIRADAKYPGKQDQDYFSGLSTQSAGSTDLCMHLVTILRHGQAMPHDHRYHESAVYVLACKSGTVRTMS